MLAGTGRKQGSRGSEAGGPIQRWAPCNATNLRWNWDSRPLEWRRTDPYRHPTRPDWLSTGTWLLEHARIRSHLRASGHCLEIALGMRDVRGSVHVF